MNKTIYEELLSSQNIGPNIRNLLSGAMIVRADNISKYLNEVRLGVYETLQSFPTVIPPSPVTWVEFTEAATPDTEYGYLCIRQNFEDSRHKLPVEYQFVDARWLVVIYGYGRKKNCQTLLWGGLGAVTFQVFLKKDGAVVQQPDGQYYVIGEISPYFIEAAEMNNIALDDNLINREAEILGSVLFTFALMQCKNVVVEAVEPFSGEMKKRNRHRLKPKFRYHVLKIRPMTVRQGAGKYLGGGAPSLHIRHGHFKTYTEEKPLFGRFSGVYWWEASVVGRNSKTTVLKDYDVLPPADDYPKRLTDKDKIENDI